MIGWGIIGAGDIAERHVAPAIRDAVGHRLVAVMRRTMEGALDFASRHQAARAYDNVRHLLDDPEVNAVYIGTPPHVHMEETLQAAEAGKHVLCEKPMALNSTECRAMIDACRRAGVQLAICYYQRFNTRHQQIKRWLETGGIGRPTSALVNFAYRYRAKEGLWRHDPKISGGGPMMDLGVHCLDLLTWLCGPVGDIQAIVDSLDPASRVEDTATLLLRMQSGMQAVITTHWTTQGFEPEQFNRLEIHGTEGSILAAPTFSKDSSGVLRLHRPDGIEDHSVSPGGVRPHIGLLEAFAGAVDNGGPSPIPGEAGLMHLEIIERARQVWNSRAPRA
ncbi:MAG: Gfo/Idh/MocA family protein [Bryobacteraceae bacterium]